MILKVNKNLSKGGDTQIYYPARFLKESRKMRKTILAYSLNNNKPPYRMSSTSPKTARTAQLDDSLNCQQRLQELMEKRRHTIKLTDTIDQSDGLTSQSLYRVNKRFQQRVQQNLSKKPQEPAHSKIYIQTSIDNEEKRQQLLEGIAEIQDESQKHKKPRTWAPLFRRRDEDGEVILPRLAALSSTTNSREHAETKYRYSPREINPRVMFKGKQPIKDFNITQLNSDLWTIPT